MKPILTRTRKPDIIFNRCGNIFISARAAKMLQLQAGDTINVAEDSGEYYLYKAMSADRLVGKYMATLRTPYPRATCLRTNAKEICRVILNAAGEAEKAKLPLGDIARLPGIGEALPIITRLKL